MTQSEHCPPSPPRDPTAPMPLELSSTNHHCSPKYGRHIIYSRLQKSGHARSGNGREVAMLTRRGFSGFASCAICGLAGFVATDALAQGSPPAGSPSFRRKILSQTDGPVPGYVTIIVDAEVDPGVTVSAAHSSGNRVCLYCGRQLGAPHRRPTDTHIQSRG
jgi:hypothetical protein